MSIRILDAELPHSALPFSDVNDTLTLPPVYCTHVQRLAIGFGLAVLLVGMFVHYGAVAPAHDPSPTAAELRADYASHVGDSLYVWADVIDRDADHVTVQFGSPPDGIVLSVRTTRADIDRGDVIQLYGTLRPNRVVVPDRIVVSDRTGLTGLYTVSVIAAVGTAAAFLRSWRFDRSQYGFVPRDGDRSDA
ncbi:MAG: hypothetical protein ABEJ48_09110 [Halobacteriales archaeon]